MGNNSWLLDPTSSFPGSSPSGAYPTMPNSYGLGTNGLQYGPAGASPGGASPGGASPGGAQAPQLAAPPTSDTSRGFNPWSLSGESNARSPGLTPGMSYF